jgi:heat shock protein beta
VDDDELDAMTPEQREKELQTAREEQLKTKRKKFETFYKEFGKAIKLGIVEDSANRKKLTSLLRFKSSKYNNMTSFEEYIKRMQENQDVIYYLSGEKEEAIRSDPVFRKMVELDYEMLICDEAVDEFALQQVRDYDGYKIKNIGNSDFIMPTENENSRKRKKALDSMFEPLKKYLEKTLFEYVDKVAVSSKGTLEAAIVTSSEGGLSAFMEKISRANSFSKKNNEPRNEVKRVMEINPEHLVIQKLLSLVKANETGAESEAIAHSLYETAAMQSGYYIRNPDLYANHFYNVFSSALGVMGQERREIEYDLDAVDLGPEDDEPEQPQAQVRIEPEPESDL